MPRRKEASHAAREKLAWEREYRESQYAEKMSVKYPKVKSVRIQIDYEGDPLGGKPKSADRTFVTADGAAAHFWFNCPYWSTCLTSLKLNQEVQDMVQKKEVERNGRDTCMGDHREWHDGHKCLMLAQYKIAIEYSKE